MKNLFSIILVLFCISNTYAQIGVKANNTAPIPSAQLEVQSTTKAFYPPRMTTMERTMMPNAPLKGAMVFDTDLNGLFTYNGSSWVSGSGLTLPYSATQNISSNIFSLTNTSTTTSSSTIYSETNGTDNDVAGVGGFANNNSPTGRTAGVKGVNTSTNTFGSGVFGQHIGSGIGVEGTSSTGIGGNFSSTFGYALITGTGNVGIGTNTPNAPLQFNNAALNRKIVLYETANNNHQFYGLGINGFTFRYQVDGTSASHVFYAATGTTTSNELMRITGTGNVNVAGEVNRAQTADANLVPIAYGGVTNANGLINSTISTSNVSCIRTATGVYEITITGEAYSTASYPTYVTLATANLFFGFISIGSSGGKLIVYIADASGTPANAFFHFVIYEK